MLNVCAVNVRLVLNKTVISAALSPDSSGLTQQCHITQCEVCVVKHYSAHQNFWRVDHAAASAEQPRFVVVTTAITTHPTINLTGPAWVTTTHRLLPTVVGWVITHFFSIYTYIFSEVLKQVLVYLCIHLLVLSYLSR